MRLALFQPDIPQNTGTLLRLAACTAVPVDIIEPCGFVWDDRRLRRAGLDYIASTLVTRHASWQRYRESAPGRLVLLTTRGDTRYSDFTFDSGDTLLLGRESAGVPEEVHAAAAARLVIPMAPGQRSLNVAVAGAMVLGEALRQTDNFPRTQGQDG
ncbi:tRNA (cytidine(34)-2'-O)-methyltransferase [Fodinicurvata fenggangensis]|uniref:tRNA (cytidine(34)-2'-O)-methyltransferase n=1 Tax=Fodinicurvata fenggangensis TaxID=1121830 RepID=UPI000479BE58|nr:tRNA (cytidine(34)-2'-O)-methyltransferase [Fodinicurvata fenggangensis]